MCVVINKEIQLVVGNYCQQVVTFFFFGLHRTADPGPLTLYPDPLPLPILHSSKKYGGLNYRMEQNQGLNHYNLISNTYLNQSLQLTIA